MSTNPNRYAPAGYCIYCGEDDCDLTDEQIVPYSLRGDWILPKSSCERCRKITHAFETKCTHESGNMFSSFRARLKLPSRRRWTSENKVTTTVEYPDGRKEKVSFAADSFPAMIYGILMPTAGIINCQAPSETFVGGTVTCVGNPGENFQLPKGKLTLGKLHIGPFLRLIAKIAYSHAIANGAKRADIHPMLREMILGECDTYSHLIGGNWPSAEPDDVPYCHSLRAREVVFSEVPDAKFTLILVHLFGQFGLPKYHVVIGQRPFDKGSVINQAFDRDSV